MAAFIRPTLGRALVDKGCATSTGHTGAGTRSGKVKMWLINNAGLAALAAAGL